MYQFVPYTIEYFDHYTIQSNHTHPFLSTYPDQLKTSLLANVTSKLQPSADVSLQCSALMPNIGTKQYDLVAISCHQKFSQVVMCTPRYENTIMSNKNTSAHSMTLDFAKVCDRGWLYGGRNRCVKMIKTSHFNDSHSTCSFENSRLHIADTIYKCRHSGYMDVNGVFHRILFTQDEYACTLLEVKGYGLIYITRPRDSTLLTTTEIYIEYGTEPCKVKYLLNKEKNNVVVEKCQVGQTACNDQTCIWNQWLCDGDSDCVDSSDEENCSHTCRVSNKFPGTRFCSNECKQPDCRCHPMLFQCQQGGCIQSNSLCNRVTDCMDGSDEMHCHNLQLPLHSRVQVVGKFKCDDGSYISMSLVNDLMPDCPDTEDETLINYIKQEDPLLVDIYSSNFTCLSGLMCHSRVPVCFQLDEFCLYDLDSFGNIKYCRHGYHLLRCEVFHCEGNFKCPKSYCLPAHRVCDSVSDCPNGEDERVCQGSLVCPGLLKCPSGLCIQSKYICDGQVHCGPEADDEALCSQPVCPQGCTCMSASVDCNSNNMSNIMIEEADRPFVKIVSYKHNHLTLQNLSFNKFDSLYSLDISDNNLAGFNESNKDMFWQLISLVHLNLSNNILTILPPMLFATNSHLRSLDIRYNIIHSVGERAFFGTSIAIIDLGNQEISYLHKETFTGLAIISHLILMNNYLKKLPEGIFAGIGRILLLDLKGNSIKSLHKDNIKSISHVGTMIVDDVWLCCMAHRVDHCVAQRDTMLSTCEDLLASVVLRVFIWIVFLGVVGGNIAVLILRWISWRASSLTENVLIVNLSVADLLMGIYLMVLLVHDIVYSGEFVIVSPQWIHSISCKIMAVLSTVSPIMSLYTVTVIGVSRCLNIVYKFKLTTKSIVIVLCSLWLWTVFIVSLPLTGADLFHDWHYIHSEVCLLFYFSHGLHKGWPYRFVFFIFCSLVSIFIMTVSYIKISIYIKRTVAELKVVGSTTSYKQSAIICMSILVVSGLALWFPVLMISILTLATPSIPHQISR